MKDLFVVKYIDDDKLEVIVESREDFLKWLAAHNESRKEDYLDDDDFCEETEDDFELTRLILFKP